MSQKSSRRSRRHTSEDEVSPAKSVKSNGAEQTVSPVQEEINGAKPEENGSGTMVEPEKNVTKTRSRSHTPQTPVKNKEALNGHDLETVTEEKETVAVEMEKNEEKDTKPAEDEEMNKPTEENETTDEATKDIVEENMNFCEMDPLIITDEVDPELIFEENSDLESGRSSPILTRCKTRRSQTRNIPTPKTPKLAELEEHEISPSPVLQNEQDLNMSFESCSEHASTKAEAGSDSTRLEYMNKDISNSDGDSFLVKNKSKSFAETLRHLSTRRTIRPVTDVYRKRVLEQEMSKSNRNVNPLRNTVEPISVGVKRKNLNEDQDSDSNKRFRADSPGFFGMFPSPIAFRNPFRSDMASSTPKLTGYKDDKFLLEGNGTNSKMCDVQNTEKRWCSIM